jgi:dTDP-4-dehydrorhamnose 3,5-epimerase
MKIIKTPIDGFNILKPNIYEDNRGFFLETFQEKKYQELGIKDKFVQDNQSRSFKGILRGMHFQHKYPQAQIVTVIRGSIFDVGVDLRVNSESFGKWFGVELNDSGSPQVYMAPGIAHGFFVKSEFADLHYKVSRYYDSEDERGLCWNDSSINIKWPTVSPIINERDAGFPLLSELIENNQLPHLSKT